MDENNLDTVTQDDQGMRDDNNLLSDVIEVIATDPDFRESTAQQNTKMFNGGGEIPAPRLQPSIQPQSAQQSRRQAYVRIIEQPASKALRFRYECEGRSAGSIPGASSSPENKTFPTIQIVGYQGKAVVVVSCVTKDPPHRPHPHNLVGREGCKRGVCTLEIPTDTMTVHFSNLGIQCVKKKDIEHALRVREDIRVDPFRTGFGHRNQPTSIDLNAVRLCFQVFLEGDKPGKFSVPLVPVVSDPIYDKKAMSDLSIIKLSDCVSYVDGGRKDIILLCEKVAKEDIQVRFYEEKGDWEAFADFQPSQVHKQHAIWFRTPKYKTLEVTEPVKVFIQLRRPSDGAASEPLPFELLPLDSEPGALKRKRQKIDDPSGILKHLQENDSTGRFAMNVLMDKIKSEPRESASSPYSLNPYGGISPGYAPNLSPQYNISLGPATPLEYVQYNPPSNNPNLPGNSPQHHMWNNSSASTSPQLPMWNIPTTSTVPNSIAPSNNTLLDLDSQELNINSDEIVETLKTIDPTPLPEIENLSFSDVVPNQDHNMTDSLTRLANNTIDSLCQLNNMYPSQQ